MRIPSQFTEDNLYRRARSKQPVAAGNSIRRLIRLVVVLMLVVVVMHQASQPGLYAVFFGPGQVPDSAGTAQGNAAPKADGFSLTIPAADDPTAMAAAKIARGLDRRQQRNWTTILSSCNQSKQFTLMRPVAAEMVSILKKQEDWNGKQQAHFVQTFEKFESLFAKGQLLLGGERLAKNSDSTDEPESSDTETTPPELDQDDQVRLIAVLDALDTLAIDRVYDGAPLQAADFDAFYRLLDQAPVMNRRDASAIAAVPLMQQSEAYIGKMIRVEGRLALIQTREAAAYPFGITEFYKCWIKPDTGADRPIVFAVPVVPEEVAEAVKKERNPNVVMIGRFLKRFPYRSQKGADAAPLVIGRIDATALIEPPKTAKQIQQESKLAKESSRSFLMILGAAIVSGIAIACLVMWRTSISAKRTRAIRLASQESSLSFDGLENAVTKPTERESS